MLASAKVKKLENEIQSLKSVQPLSGGALTKHSITASWQGTIDKNAPINRYSMLAAFIATFERDDGQQKPPIVQFSYTVEPTNDDVESAIIGASGDSVQYKLILDYDWWPDGESATTVTAKITINAYSLVDGHLTIQRVYS